MQELQCNLNYTATGEQAPEIERAIRVIKERILSIVTSWPSTKVPITFKVNMVKAIIFWLNAISTSKSIIPNISSKTLLLGTFPKYNKHCTIPFGTYAHVHNPQTQTNTMAARTSPCISMGPTSNLQGSHRFYCLQTK